MSKSCEVSPLVSGMVKKLLVVQRDKLPKNIIAEEVKVELNTIIANIGNLNVCGKGERKAMGKGGRKANPRSKWLSRCMKKPENGGLGKDMKSCSDEYKEKGYETLDKEYGVERFYEEQTSGVSETTSDKEGKVEETSEEVVQESSDDE